LSPALAARRCGRPDEDAAGAGAAAESSDDEPPSSDDESRGAARFLPLGAAAAAPLPLRFLDADAGEALALPLPLPLPLPLGDLALAGALPSRQMSSSMPSSVHDGESPGRDATVYLGGGEGVREE